MLKSDRIPLTVIPQGFFVQYGPAKVAYGATKPKSSGGGGAKPTGMIAREGSLGRRGLTSYASKRG